MYDDAVRTYIKEIGEERLGPMLLHPENKKKLPTFENPDMTLETLLGYGDAIVAEQENVKRV